MMAFRGQCLLSCGFSTARRPSQIEAGLTWRYVLSTYWQIFRRWPFADPTAAGCLHHPRNVCRRRKKVNTIVDRHVNDNLSFSADMYFQCFKRERNRSKGHRGAVGARERQLEALCIHYRKYELEIGYQSIMLSGAEVPWGWYLCGGRLCRTVGNPFMWRNWLEFWSIDSRFGLPWLVMLFDYSIDWNRLKICHVKLSWIWRILIWVY